MRPLSTAALLAITTSTICAVAYAATGPLAPTPPIITVVSSAAGKPPTAAPVVGQAAGAAPVSTSPIATAQAAAPFTLGVQTHFSQGWPSSWLLLAGQARARNLRDGIPWSAVEKTPGVYDFSGAAVATLASHCADGGTMSLTIVPSNALHDGGKTVFSDAGRRAYAGYIAALLRRFNGCVSAIEVGNEVNGAGTLDYPAGYDPYKTYTALLQTLSAAIKPAFPSVALLGGSTNTVGTGFLEGLFKAGALPFMDGIAVHPYRSNGEGLALEIAHLNEVMARYGKPKPIWATEFSYDLADGRQVAAGMVKSVVELNSAGVTRATWYSLVDQKWFPNMGLFTGTAIKPAGRAFQLLTERVLPYGKPVRVDTGTLPLMVYRVGEGRWVAWGAPATLTFAADVTVRDVLGAQIARGTRVTLGAEPVILEGASAFTVTDAPVLADTLMQWGTRPWSYARRDTKVETALGWFDNDFTSYFGDRWSKPLRIDNSRLAPAGDGKAPMRAIIRYTAPAAQQVELNACFTKSAATGDGVDYRLEQNGKLVSAGVIIDRAALRALRLNLAAGDRVDLVFGPNQTYGGDGVNYRVTLNRPGYPGLPCA